MAASDIYYHLGCRSTPCSIWCQNRKGRVAWLYQRPSARVRLSIWGQTRGLVRRNDDRVQYHLGGQSGVTVASVCWPQRGNNLDGHMEGKKPQTRSSEIPLSWLSSLQATWVVTAGPFLLWDLGYEST